MSAQFDAIAEQYRRSKGSPLRTYVEAYTFLALIGDLSRKAVLDLACGDGFYTRQIKMLGAAKVIGVDISSAMIELAEEQEREHPIGLSYVCADVAELPELGPFDIAVAAYLLHYAKNEDQLERMCRSIARHLPANGRFVTLNDNPEQSVERYAGYEQYGFNKHAEQPRLDGSEITYFMVAGRELFKFSACFFSRDTYERALRSAGFNKITWHPLSLDNAGINAHGAEYWHEYMSNPPIIGLECQL